MDIFERRLAKFKTVASNRQDDVAIVLENIHDPHNIGAILRSCDSVGVHHIYLINTDQKLQSRNIYEKLSSASGAAKWLKLRFYNELDTALVDIRAKFEKLYTTHLSSEAGSIYEMEMTNSFALAFGNEHEGISDELLAASDQNVIIPQYGMVQSLNISVACAVCLFEICRQKNNQGNYPSSFDEQSEQHQQLFKEYQDIHKAKKLKRIRKKP